MRPSLFALPLLCISTVSLAAADAPPSTSPAVAAEKPRAVVLAVTFRGDGPIAENARVNIDGYLEAALDQLGYAKVDDSARDAMLDADSGKLRSCLSTLACKLALAERLNAGMGVDVDVVRAEIPVDEPAAPEPEKAKKSKREKKAEKAEKAAAAAKPHVIERWQVAVTLYPMDVRVEGAKAASEAPYASLDDVRTGLFSVLGKALAGERAHGRGTLRIGSNPPGASVLVDDSPVGQTGAADVACVVYAGKHKVRVQVDDKKFQEQDLDVAANAAVRFAPDFLGPPPVAKDCVTRAQKVERVLGPLLLGAGVGAAAFGAYALSQNGKLTQCGDAANPASCTAKISSLTTGIAALAPGGAAILTGAILTGVGFKKCKQPLVSFSPVVAPGLTAGTLSIDF